MRALFCLLTFAGLALGQAKTLLVLHKGAGTLGFYSESGKMMASAPVGAHPHEMVLSPDGRYVYTTDNGTMRIEQAGAGGNTVSIVEIATRRKVGEISLGKFHRPHGIAWNRSSGRLLVSTENPDQLLVLDPVKRSVVRTYDVKGKTAHMVSVDLAGRWAYVSNSTSANVSAVDLQTGRVKLIPSGERPEGSVVSKDGKYVFVANRESHTITVIDTARQEAVGKIATGKGPVRLAMTPDGRQLVYALLHERAVEIADPVTHKVLAKIPVPAGAPLVSLSVSPDGRLAYTSAEDEDTVYAVSLADRKVARKFTTARGAAPDPVIELP